MWFVILVGVVIALIFYKYSVRPLKFWEERGVLYSKPRILLGNLGNFVFRKQHIAEIWDDLYKEFRNERYSGVFQFSQPNLLVRDLDLIKQIAIKDFDHFTDHFGIVRRDVDPLLARVLFQLKGLEWKEMRATLSPAFTSAKMKNLFFLMTECGENLTNHFLNQSNEVQSLDMRDTFNRYTIDVIASTVFGIKVDSLKNPDNEFLTMGRKMTTQDRTQILRFAFVRMFPSLAKILGITMFRKCVTDFFHKIVHETIVTREAENIVRPDILHLLMEARKGKLNHESLNDDSDAGFATVEESDIGKDQTLQKKELTDLEITAQCLIFFFGGFETVSLTSCFTSYELALNPEIQSKLQEEIDDVLKKSNNKLTYDALLKMKYLDQVISEAIRKWTPGFQLDRLCVKDYVIKANSPEEKDFKVEKDMVILIPVMAIHRDPEYFPEPEKFDPDRFSEENKSKIVPGSYMPFGVGPRNCIGSRFALLATKVVMFYLLSKFDIVPVQNTQIPLKLSVKMFNLATDNFCLGLKLRKTTTL